MKVRFYCDSGANIHSERSEIIDIEAYGYTDKEWNSMTEEEKIKEVELWAWDFLAIGYEEME